MSRSSFDFGIAAFTVYRNRRPSRAREGLEPPGCGLHRSVLRIAEAVRGLAEDRALIDGEAVVLMDDGRSDFGALMTKRGGAQAPLVAFDLLRLEGDDQRLRPLEERREALMWLVDGVSGILFSEAVAAEGAVVFAKASEFGLEGIVSKRQGSFYRSGRSRNWLKTRNPNFIRT